MTKYDICRRILTLAVEHGIVTLDGRRPPAQLHDKKLECLVAAIDDEQQPELMVEPAVVEAEAVSDDLSTPREDMLTPTGRRDYAP